MGVPNFLTITEQVADYLRGEIIRGRWIGIMPGMNSLAHAKAALNKAEEPGELLFFMGSVGRWAKTAVIL